MASRDYLEEVERTRGLLSLPEIGVTEADYARAALDPATQGLLGIEPPKHWIEEARERDGSGKFFGKMLLGGLTGMTPFLFPEMFGAKDRYKAEMAGYIDAQEQLRQLQQLNSIDPSKPGLSGIAIASDVNKELGDYYTDTYIGNQNSSSWVADQARRADMSYREFMAMDEKARNALIWQNATDEERGELDWLAGRQTPQQKADEAAMVTKATEQAKADVQTEQTEKSQQPQMQVAFDTLNDVLNKGDYHAIYGTVDSRTPTYLQSSQDAQTQIEKVSAILYMFARGELKGQGQVTEDEAAWAMKSRSSLMDFKQGDEAARAEMMLIQRQLGERLGITDESMYYGYQPSIDELVDQYAD
jgi:hypothetical protein